MRQVFEIPGRLPGLNDINRANRSGWQSGNSQMRAAKNTCIKAVEEAGLKPFDGHVSIGFTWIEPNNRRDLGNIRAGEKFISDALVSCGIIPDDGPRYVRRMFDVFACNPDNPRVIVELTDESE